jgi:hypothetical protein
VDLPVPHVLEFFVSFDVPFPALSLCVHTEQHVKMLHRLNQTVPQSIAILLSDARRKEEKRNAKRVANRRSASSSRLRKKTLVKEMTEMNAHLKRQALILALLPDLVIVVDREGIITFCSAQVERVLKHKIDDLIGVPLTDLLVPNSRGKLSFLVEQLVDFDKVANTQASPAKNGANCVKEESNVEAKAGTSISDAALGYDPVFPLSIVKVKAICDVECKNNSDSSTRNQLGNRIPSSLTNSQSLSRSPTTSSMENSGSDADAQIARSGKDAKKSDRSEKAALSSDNSNSSYVTADTKKLQKANANLVRNVRWHNKKMKDQELVEQLGTAFKDDVIGADVTANNASARLSSLQHRPEPSSSGDDSGYRESNGSRDETSSSSDSSESNGKNNHLKYCFPWTRHRNLSHFTTGRPKPIAPTCNVCLIKNDLTTLWCEVTSSIRTAELNKESDASSREETKSRSTSKASLEAKSLYASAEVESMTSSREEVIELLLCLRPIRDGEMVDEQYRFVPRDNLRLNPFVSESSKASSGDEVYDKSSTSEEQHIYSQSRPPKKRLKLSCAKDCTDDRRNTEHVCIGEDKAVIESLMLMSSELPKKLRACERKYHG